MFHDLVDFAALLYTIPVRIVSPKPKPLEPHWNIVKPFSFRVWILIVIVLVMACFIWAEISQPKRHIFSPVISSRDFLMPYKCLTSQREFGYKSYSSNHIKVDFQFQLLRSICQLRVLKSFCFFVGFSLLLSLFYRTSAT